VKLAPGLVLALVLAAATARAGPPPLGDERIAVIVGANLGDADEEPLRYAESDARRVRDLLVAIGGVRPSRAILITGGAPETVLRALREARGRAAELGASGARVTLVFYYSGHGDDGALHLPEGNLGIRELRRAIAEVPADVRISILDSCRTPRRRKGVTRGPSFALAAAPGAPRGTVELRASSEGEAAQESDELGASVFTHFLASGLRGDADADADGRVTLSELYSYVHRRTLLRTGVGPALQHPAATIDVTGAGEIILSQPAAAGAFLAVPGGADRYLVFSLPTGAVVGELSGASPQRLALPAGEFLVTRRAGARIAIAQVDLSWGGTKTLGDDDFRSISREELAARGGRVELRALRLEPQLGAELALRGADGPAARAGAAFGWAYGSLVLALDAGYVGGTVDTAGTTGASHALRGGPSIGWRTSRGRWTASISAGIEMRQVWQRLDRRDADRARAAGLPATITASHRAIGPRAGLRASVPLGYHLSLGVDVSMTALVRPELADEASTTMALHPVLSTTLGVSYAF
jgi:hypothetical protein